MNLHKKQVYSGLLEIIKDEKCYYRSRIGAEYCKFTEEGIRALAEYMSIMAPHMIKKDEDEKLDYAKNIAWDELKK
jgi:hypothetical protein